MAKQNVERHRRAIEAFNAHDAKTLIALSDPSIEIHSAMTSPGGAVYHGHDGLRRYFGDLEDAWGDKIRLVPETFFELDEQTLVFQVARGRGIQSGVEVERLFAQVCRWRDGLMVYFKVHLSKEDALEDLGVSEDALEPIAP